MINAYGNRARAYTNRRMPPTTLNPVNPACHPERSARHARAAKDLLCGRQAEAVREQDGAHYLMPERGKSQQDCEQGELRGFGAALARALGVADANGVDCGPRSEEHTSELQSQSNLVCRLLLEKKND